ncbi:MAG: helix-turn-helix domain-containing protein [Candidatus Thiodiazotropha lotti]|nr:helix-turn-helix domain-containing protein [Candidatus Thiodiazotropha lotti]MCW4221333.1 helix-turn-helix domain-containing protein [Candidatus Thiodiazotropha lotti]
MSNTPLVVTYAEAGKMLLGISEQTVRRMVSDGDLPYVKVRGRVGIPYDALLEYVKNQTRYAESKQHREQYLTTDQIVRSDRSRAPITQADRLAELVKLGISKKQKR